MYLCNESFEPNDDLCIAGANGRYDLLYERRAEWQLTLRLPVPISLSHYHEIQARNHVTVILVVAS